MSNGAGEEGTDKLRDRYLKDTPGQDKIVIMKSFLDYLDDEKEKDSCSKAKLAK